MRDTRAKHHGANHWLMLDLIQRKIGLDAQRLYEERGHAEGRELENWLKAASEVLATLNASEFSGNSPARAALLSSCTAFRRPSRLVYNHRHFEEEFMHPPKKLPANPSDLRDHSRNARQKSVLLCEVTRLHVKTSDKLCHDSQQLAGKELPRPHR